MTHSSPLESIFFAALQKQPGPDRSEYLDQACAGDAELRRQLDRMLAAQANASFMQHPLLAGDATVNHAIIEGPGTIIGPYKLLQQIGEGGFGVVYMAEQEKPVKRRVALKVIKAGMDTHAVIARFEAERQALAMMDHPNIARVLDAGATGTGRPYFVMELVKGIPITDYCDQANLDMRQRLSLFMDVCRAVQHAHQKGVIHRDLKPSNIMITLHDSKPVVKVIDFGIAKATDHKLTEKTLFTNYGQMIGTPVYMSPEQAVMSGLDVDTRSDIYSLGVLLYELLTGSPPFDAQTLRQAGFDEMRRIIREEAPQKPSTRLSTLADDVKLTVANQRQVSPQVLSRQLHGDLDWIILKAIEKDRARRYESASAFAQDIERHLKSEPVAAAAPSTGYKLRKFIQRNKAPMAAAAAIAFLMLAGTTISTWQAFRATHAKGIAVAAVSEKDRALIAEAEQHKLADISKAKAIEAASAAQAANDKAQKRLAQIQKANDLLGSIFENLDPLEIAKHDRPLQAILVEKLDKAVEQLEGESIGDPLVVAKMQKTFGRSLLGLGEGKKAVILLERANATYQALLPPDDPERLSVLNHLALAYERAGNPDKAIPLLEEAYRLWNAHHGPIDEQSIMFMNNLATIYLESGKRDRGMPLLIQALKLARENLGPDDIGTITAINNLGLSYFHGDDAERALPLLEESVQLSKTVFGPTHPQTLVSMNNLAGTYVALGKVDLGVALYEHVVKSEKIILGFDHLDTLTAMNNLAGAYQAAGKLDLAIPLNEETLKMMTIKAGPEHPHTVACMDNLARGYYAADKLDLAVPLLERVLKLEKKVYGPDDRDTLITMDTLARAYQSIGKIELAVPLREDLLKRQKAVLGPTHRNTLSSMTSLAGAYYRTHQIDKAIPLYETAIKGLTAEYGRDHENTVLAMACLGQNYMESNRVAEGLPLLEQTHQFVEKYPELHRFDHTLYDYYVAQGNTKQAAALMPEMIARARKSAPDNILLQAGELATQGRALIDKEHFVEAEKLLRQCLAIREKSQPDNWTTFNTQSLLGAALLSQKKYTDAEPLLVAGYEGMKSRQEEIPPIARPRVAEALQRLITLYQFRAAEGDAAKAAEYRKRLDQFKAILIEGSQPEK